MAPAMDAELREEYVLMTRDAQQSRKQVCGLRTQLANARTIAARVAYVAPKAPEDRGEKFQDSLAIAQSDRT